MDVFERLEAYLAQRHSQPLARAAGITLALLRALYAGHLLDRSASLAYTTLLSLIPLLAVSFSVLKAFGAHDTLEPLLRDALSPLGAQGMEVASRIVEFVGRMQVGVLGWVGVVLLFYTVITLVHKIELAFNATWGVPTARRPARRIADYLSVILIGPVMIFAALGFTDSVRAALTALGLGAFQPLAEAGSVLLLLLPHLLGGLTFAFLYGFLPNTHVRPTAALAGGFVASLLWFAVGRLFSLLMANSTNYPAIYSGFAGAVLFILWLNVAWLIVLLGAEVAHRWQSPFANIDPGPVTAGPEGLAFAILIEIGLAHRQRRTAPDPVVLANRLGVTEARVASLLTVLVAAGLIVETVTPDDGFVPACDPAALPLEAVLEAVHRADAGTTTGTVAGLLDELHGAMAGTLAGRSLRDLLNAAERDILAVIEDPPPTPTPEQQA